jgi:hypothetical protein
LAKIFLSRYKKKNCHFTVRSTQTHPFLFPMTESTLEIGGPTVAPAALSGLTDLKNVDDHGDGSDSKDGDSQANDYGYGDDSDSDNEDDFPIYGYERNTRSDGAFSCGDDNDNKRNADDDDDKGDGYGYGEDKDAGSPADVYDYGNDAALSHLTLLDVVLPARPRRLRRNSCLIRKEQNPLAVAEYLLGGPPRMSDRDMELRNVHNEGAISA